MSRKIASFVITCSIAAAVIVAWHRRTIGIAAQPAAKRPASTSTSDALAAYPQAFLRAPGEFVASPRRVILEGEARLPIDLVTGMPVISFDQPNGSKQRMLIDTGADSMIMTPSLVAAAHLTTRPSNGTSTDASGTVSGIPIVLVTRLQFGGARFEDFDADMGQLYAGVDALIGYPIWKDVLLTIDYPGRMVRIKRGMLPPPDGRTILPVRMDERSRLTIPVTLDGREIWLNMDSGWGVGGTIEFTALHAGQIEWASAPVPMMNTSAVHGTAPERLGRIEGDLMLGRYRFVRPIAGVNSGLGADIFAAIGLANFIVTLDLAHQRVRFERQGDDRISSGPVYVAGFDCDLRSDPLPVLHVLPGSDAERCGLLAGDQLLTVDGHPAREGLLAHSGGPFALTLRRRERQITLSVPMTKLVP